jgi:hypothetical protein
MQADDVAHCANSNVHASHFWRAPNKKMIQCPGHGLTFATRDQPALAPPLDRIGTALGALNEAYTDLRRSEAGITPGNQLEAAYDQLVAVLNGLKPEVERLLWDVFGDPHGNAIEDVLQRLDVWLRQRAAGAQ